MTWFRDLFGFEEGARYDENRAAFHVTPDGFLVTESAPPLSRRMYLGDFGTPSLAKLRALVAEMPSVTPSVDRDGDASVENDKTNKGGGLSFAHLADPVGIASLVRDPKHAGAVFQAASQFNCLEMVGPKVTPRQGVTGYADDPTQGPKCAMACPAALVFRNYLCGEDGKGQGHVQIDCLSDVGEVLGNVDGSVWSMRNGYALPADDERLIRLNERLLVDEKLVERAEAALRVGVHWDTSVAPPATHTVAQVFASAMPVAYAKHVRSATWAPLASLVLRAAYEATLAAAVVISRKRGGERVKVFLTALGGGAFGNRAGWIREAIERALERYRDEPLDVVLVHYGTVVKSDLAIPTKSYSKSRA